jgi:hypothetical protein
MRRDIVVRRTRVSCERFFGIMSCMLVRRSVVRQRCVSALYLSLLNGNFHPPRASEAEWLAFRQDLRLDLRLAARDFHPADAEALLGVAWRESLVAAWISGLKGWRELIPRMSELLLASATCFAGQGYCGALALMPCEASAAALRAYLDRYVARPDLDYDQRWALAAIRIVDRALGTDSASTYTAPGGAWETFCARQRRPPEWGFPPLELLLSTLQGCLADEPR